MQRAARLIAFALLCAACHKAADPLTEQRAICSALADKKELRQGLTVQQCAEEMKAALEKNDPTRKAEDLINRIAAVISKGRGAKQDLAQSTELRESVRALEYLGTPAVAATLSGLQRSIDPELRTALAGALVTMCASDCLQAKYDCMVPALVEGLRNDRPAAAHAHAAQSLAQCTGADLGEDAAAWNRWLEDPKRGTARAELAK